MPISSSVLVLVEVGVEVILFRTDGGRVEVIIMLSQLSDVVVVEAGAGAELGNSRS